MFYPQDGNKVLKECVLGKFQIFFDNYLDWLIKLSQKQTNYKLKTFKCKN